MDGVREMGRNENWDRFVAVTVIITVIGTPHDVPMLTGFVVLQWAETRARK